MQSVHSCKAALAFVAAAFSMALGLTVPMGVAAREKAEKQPYAFGLKLRAGGRFDNVRMCVASSAGVQGGPAADISLFAEIGLKDTISVDIDLPLFRPILFAAAFKMLQFEPSITFKFRTKGNGKIDLVGGPTLGLSLHYGPDYKSESSGSGRTTSFFAMGPIIGGYVGLDFKRPNKSFNFQLGLTPYLEVLYGVNDGKNHRGIVVGGLLDFQFRFRKKSDFKKKKVIPLPTE